MFRENGFVRAVGARKYLPSHGTWVLGHSVRVCLRKTTEATEAHPLRRLLLLPTPENTSAATAAPTPLPRKGRLKPEAGCAEQWV